MCGICGIVRSSPADVVRQGRLFAMRDALEHRGPDEAGLYLERNVGLAMRRLSIIDLEGGQQPQTNETRSVRVCCNGEIYNYRELRKRLVTAGHVFASASDTEVIVHAYEEYGDEFAAKLRGMFAVCVWDDERKRLLLAVDRFGIKPLYYSTADGGIAFSSELGSLMRAGTIPKAIDFCALAQFFRLGFIPPSASVYSSVQKLAPGHLLVWDGTAPTQPARYWQLPVAAETDHGTPAGRRAALRAHLREAVASHLVSDVPLGVLLSGGIDSASVVALASEVGSDRLATFTVGFEGDPSDERALAATVAKRYGTEHHEIVLDPNGAQLLEGIAAHFGEPFADASALPTYLVSGVARRRVKAVLSGDGGDELFLGYTAFRGLRLSGLAESIPAPMRRAGLSLLEDLPRLPNARLNDSVERFRRRGEATLSGADTAYFAKLAPVGMDPAVPYLSPELRGLMAPHDGLAVVRAAIEQHRRRSPADPLDVYVHAGIGIGLAGGMLVKVDRMSMANSLEVRVPFLDHRLAEFVARIPLAARMPHWRLKGLLKDTMADALPPEVLHAPKRGFGLPLARWFRGDLAGFATERLLSPEARTSGAYDPTSVAALLEDHRAGRRDTGGAIWTLLMFELWRSQTGALS